MRGVLESEPTCLSHISQSVSYAHPDRLQAMPACMAFPHHLWNISILELGCGSEVAHPNGRTPSARFIGIDIDDQAIAAAQHKSTQLGLDNVEWSAPPWRIGASTGGLHHCPWVVLLDSDDIRPSVWACAQPLKQWGPCLHICLGHR